MELLLGLAEVASFLYSAGTSWNTCFQAFQGECGQLPAGCYDVDWGHPFFRIGILVRGPGKTLAFGRQWHLEYIMSLGSVPNKHLTVLLLAHDV